MEVSRLAFERTKKMHDDKLISDQVFEQADAELEDEDGGRSRRQKKRITQREAMLASNRDDLEKTDRRRPMDGVVTSLQKEEGRRVIGAQSFSPTVIMTVADLSVMEVEIMVDETDIRNVRSGQAAEVRVDALEGVKIKGEVTEIGSSAIPRGLTEPAGQRAPTPPTRPRTSRSRSRSRTRRATPAAGPERAPPTSRPPSKENVLAVPIQAGGRPGRSTSEGKVVDPRSAPGVREPIPPPPRQKGQEKEGVFVVERRARPSFRPGQDRHHRRDRDRDRRRPQGRRARSSPAPTRRCAPCKDQAKIKLEVKKAAREHADRAPPAVRRQRRPHPAPRTSGAPT